MGSERIQFNVHIEHLRQRSKANLLSLSIKEPCYLKRKANRPLYENGCTGQYQRKISTRFPFARSLRCERTLNQTCRGQVYQTPKLLPCQVGGWVGARRKNPGRQILQLLRKIGREGCVPSPNPEFWGVLLALE